MIKRRFSLVKLFVFGAALFTLALTYNNVNAQTLNDAYNYSWQVPVGTARSAAMGQAGVALGGDIGFLSQNPASSAVYKFSEVTLTPMLSMNSNEGTFLGTRRDASQTRFGVSNVGFVASFPLGPRSLLRNWNFGIALNRMNDFNSIIKANGISDNKSALSAVAANLAGADYTKLDITDNWDPYSHGYKWNDILAWNTSLVDALPPTSTGKQEYIGATENLDGMDISVGGPLIESFRQTKKGNVSETVFNFGGNFADQLYVGLSLGVQSLYYEVSETYSEAAENSNHFSTGFSSFRHNYNCKTSGVGVNFKLGLIYTPVPELRFGASISTPTWMSLHDEWDMSMSSNFEATDTAPAYYADLLTPRGNYDYNFTTPFRWNVGAAYVFGKIGTVSIDYERTVYNKMKFNNPDYPNEFDVDNNSIREQYNASNIVRGGAEFRFLPNAAVRLGLQYYGSGCGDSDKDYYIGSAGLGYSSPTGFFADLAYTGLLRKNEDFPKISLYPNDKDDKEYSKLVKSRWDNSKLLLTLGFRF